MTINGVTYASADNVTATTAAQLRTEFIDATFVSTDGNSTMLSDVFTVTEAGGTVNFRGYIDRRLRNVCHDCVGLPGRLDHLLLGRQRL